MMRRVAIDMDGVLVRLYQEILHLYEVPPKWANSIETGGSIADALAQASSSIRGRSRKIRAARATEESVWEWVATMPPRWWATLKPCPQAMLLVARLVARGVDVFPLSQPLLLGPNDEGYGASCEGKRQWLVKHLPHLAHRLVLTSEKWRCCDPQDVLLIDDSPVHVREWREHGGAAVLWYQPWNRRAPEHLLDERCRLVHLEAERQIPPDLGKDLED